MVIIALTLHFLVNLHAKKKLISSPFRLKLFYFEKNVLLYKKYTHIILYVIKLTCIYSFTPSVSHNRNCKPTLQVILQS